MDMPLSSVVVPCGRPSGPSRAEDFGAAAPDIEPSAGRCVHCVLALHAIWACGGPGEGLTNRFIVTSSTGRQAAGGQPVKMQARGAGGGDVQAISLFKRANGGRGGGCGSGGWRLQRAAAPGLGWLWGRVAAVQLAGLVPETMDSHIIAGTALARG